MLRRLYELFSELPGIVVAAAGHHRQYFYPRMLDGLTTRLSMLHKGTYNRLDYVVALGRQILLKVREGGWFVVHCNNGFHRAALLAIGLLMVMANCTYLSACDLLAKVDDCRTVEQIQFETIFLESSKPPAI